MPSRIAKVYAGKNILLEIVLSLLISLGGFTAFVPNFLDFWSDTSSLAGFEALTLFASVYFLLIIYVITSYWLLRGWKVYAKEKFVNSLRIGNIINISDADVNKITQDKKNNTLNFFEKLIPWISVIIKILPIVLFINAPFFVNDIKFQFVLLIFFAGITIFEILYIDFRSTLYLKEFKEKVFEDLDKIEVIKKEVKEFEKSKDTFGKLHFEQLKDRVKDIEQKLKANIFNSEKVKKIREKLNDENVTGEIRNKIIRASIFILSLNFIMGIGFYYFLKPWNLYNPHALSGIKIIFVVSSILFLLLFFIKYSKSNTNKNNKIPVFYFIIFTLGVFLFPSVYIPKFHINPYKKANSDYFKKRDKAVKEISDKKLFPFALLNDSLKDKKIDSLMDSWLVEITSLDTSEKKKLLYFDQSNHYLRVHGKLPEFKDGNKRIEFDAAVLKPLLNFANIRKEFYPTYTDTTLNNLRPGIISDYKISKDTINVFYENTYMQIETSILPKIKEAKKFTKDDNLYGIIDKYEHPISYYSYVLNFYKEQMENASQLEYLLEEYKRLLLLKDEKIITEDLYHRKVKVLNEKIEKKFNKSIELQDSSEILIENLKSDNLKKIDEKKAIYSNFHQYKIVQYNDRFKRAQTIFLSYLADVHRVGVWIFIVQLVLLCIIFYHFYDERKNEDKSSELSDNSQNGEGFPTFQPRHFILIGVMVSVILLIPLLRPIKEGNINPEKPYWMMTIKNWYTPKFVQNVIDPKKVEKSSTTPQVSLNANLYAPDIEWRLDSTNARILKINEFYKSLIEK